MMTSTRGFLLATMISACGGGTDPTDDAAVTDAAVADGTDAAVTDAAIVGPAPTVTYEKTEYAFLAPGTLIPPIVPTATTGTAPLVFGSDLPDGLSIDATTGVISGAPNEFHSEVEGFIEYDIPIVVTDAAGVEGQTVLHFELTSTTESDFEVTFTTYCAARLSG